MKKKEGRYEEDKRMTDTDDSNRKRKEKKDRINKNDVINRRKT